jgi:hypothetical protein
MPLREALAKQFVSRRIGRETYVRENTVERFVADLGWPLLQRLEVFAALHLEQHEAAHFFPWGSLDELEGHPDVAAWAAALCNRAAAEKLRVPKELRHAIFAALVANRTPIAPEWDALIPIPFSVPRDTFEVVKNVLASLPEPRRTNALLQSLAWHGSGGKVDLGLELLTEFPSRALVELIAAHAADASTPKRVVLQKLEAIGAMHPELREVIAPHLARPVTQLRVQRAFRPSTLEDLTPHQQKQLVTTGKRYDEKSYSAAVRLGLSSPKKADDEFESFAGQLEVREIVDEKGKLAYTAFLLIDAGTIFRGKTTRVVAVIIQSTLLGVDALPMSDSALHEALQVVIA